MTTNTLITQSQLAEMLSVSQRTLERWRVEGFGPQFAKAGRRILYRLADVEQWLERSVRSSTSHLGGSNA